MAEFDYGQYLLNLTALRAGQRLDLGVVKFDFDPNEHPRDLEGRFRETLAGLKKGDTVKTSDGRVVKRADHEFQIKAPGETKAMKIGASAPSHVAHQVIADSAESSDEGSVGGAKPTKVEAPDYSKIKAYHGRVLRTAHPHEDDDDDDLYVTEDLEHAASYARISGRTGDIYEVEHEAENPLVLDTPEKAMKAFKDAGIKPLARSSSSEKRPPANFHKFEAIPFAKWAREQGYDAVVIPPSAFRNQKSNQMFRTWGMPQAIILGKARAKSKITKRED